MSVWTHISGIIRIDNLNKKSIYKLMPPVIKGSEEPLQIKIIKDTIIIIGDLRDFYKKDCDKISNWIDNLKNNLTKENILITMGIVEIEPEDGERIVYVFEHD